MNKLGRSISHGKSTTLCMLSKNSSILHSSIEGDITVISLETTQTDEPHFRLTVRLCPNSRFHENARLRRHLFCGTRRWKHRNTNIRSFNFQVKARPVDTWDTFSHFLVRRRPIAFRRDCGTEHGIKRTACSRRLYIRFSTADHRSLVELSHRKLKYRRHARMQSKPLTPIGASCTFVNCSATFRAAILWFCGLIEGFSHSRAASISWQLIVVI